MCMRACRIPTRIAAAPMVLAACAAATSGQPRCRRHRIDYATAIGDSWKQQTLLNIIKLRYGDMPIFLEIAQVSPATSLKPASPEESWLGRAFARLSKAWCESTKHVSIERLLLAD
jgi:hypothetical protein